MKKLIVIDIVGLTTKHLSQVPLPNISRIFENSVKVPIIPSFPAVTCSVQASMNTGFFPCDHGIISNGFFDCDTRMVSFWEQYDSLVERPRVWSLLKKSNPKFKTAVLFWQNSLYTDADIVITPKPIHLEKEMISWCYSKPIDFYEEIAKEYGEFDLSSYWGPFASIKSSKWIINSAKYTIQKHKPDLIMVYIPHLDYAGLKYGPNSNEFKTSLIEVDELIGDLHDFLLSNDFLNDYEIMLVSEYSFEEVHQSISPNVILRDEGLLSTRKINEKHYIDFEFSKAFAMVDHQVAHVFIKNGFEEQVKNIFEKNNSIAKVLDKKQQIEYKINHPKSGDLILCAKDDSWFNYYWWKDITEAPDFAFKVDIHRKPGFDPLELFIDSSKKTISHDTSLVKGSHGLVKKKKLENLPLFCFTHGSKKTQDVLNVIQITPIIMEFFSQ